MEVDGQFNKGDFTSTHFKIIKENKRNQKNSYYF